MNVTILTAGTLGDVLPYIELAEGLVDKGYSVKVTVDRSVIKSVSNCRVKIHSIVDPYKLSDDGRSESIMNSGGGGEFVKKINGNLQDEVLYEYLEDCKKAVSDADIILYGNLGFAASHLGEYLKIPFIAIPLTPTYISKNFPAMELKSRLIQKQFFNRMTHVYSEFIFWRGMAKTVNYWRKKSLGLRGIAFWGPFGRIRRQKSPFIYLFSASIFKRPEDWPMHVYIGGALYPKAKVVNKNLSSFIAEGDAPLVFAFGPTWNVNYEERLSLCRTIAKRLGERAVLVGPPELAKFVSYDKDTIHVPYAPYEWLFPRSKVVIHHGGAGVSHMAVKTNTPSLSVPTFADQFLWSRLLVEANYGLVQDLWDVSELESIMKKVMFLAHNKEYLQNNMKSAIRTMSLENAVETVDKVIKEYSREFNSEVHHSLIRLPASFPRTRQQAV